MVIFHSYVKLPECKSHWITKQTSPLKGCPTAWPLSGHGWRTPKMEVSENRASPINHPVFWLVVSTNPSEKYDLVSWGYYSQYIGTIKTNVPNHQPERMFREINHPAIGDPHYGNLHRSSLVTKMTKTPRPRFSGVLRAAKCSTKGSTSCGWPTIFAGKTCTFMGT
jgi:hypothetical protein